LAGYSRFGLMNALAQNSASSAPASTSQYQALVCIFLFGGNDGNNLIVPLGTKEYDAYASIRKDLALPGAALLPVTASSKEVYGLHPKLTALLTLFNNKQLAIVANVGTLVQDLTRAQYQAHQTPVPVNLFSHSDQQLQWQTSATTGFGTTGWAGRAADKVAFRNSPSTFPAFISVSGNSLMGTGEETRPATITPGAALGLQGFNTSPGSTARALALQQMLTLNTGVSLVQAASTALIDGIKDSKTVGKALAGATQLKTGFPKSGIGAQLQEIAKLIQIRTELGMSRQIFFCSLGGFDTHSSQIADQDALFAQLSPAMAAFHNATVEMQVENDVTTFTESDFGRMFQPTTNHGSDHAWGSHHIVMGGAVKGGDLYGKFPVHELGGPDDAGTRGTWIPTTSLDQYGATLASWFGVTSADLPAVFPTLANFSRKNLGFLS